MNAAAAIAFASLLAVATACSTEKRTLTWVGRPVAALVKAWGEPDSYDRESKPPSLRYAFARRWVEYQESEYEYSSKLVSYKDKQGNWQLESRQVKQLRPGSVGAKFFASCTMVFFYDESGTIRKATTDGLACDFTDSLRWPSANW